jgi:hypothetical protein
MKILTIIDVAQGANLTDVRAHLGEELKGSWDLFSAGVLREAYATAKPTRVVFVLEAESVAAAQAHLAPLPLAASGAMQVEYVELHPFVNWSLLFAR